MAINARGDYPSDYKIPPPVKAYTNAPDVISPTLPNQTFNLMNESVSYNPNTKAITLDQLKPVADISKNLPQPTFNNTQADSLVAGVQAGQKSLSDYIAAQTPTAEYTPYATKANTIFERLQSIAPELKNKGADLAQSQKEAGVLEYQKNLREANNETIIKNAEYEKLKLEAQARKDELEANSRGITSFDLKGQQGAVDRQYNSMLALKSAEAGLSFAKAQAAAGNLTAALETAEQANNVKYSAKLQEKQDLLDQLEMIKPFLTAEQAKIRDAVAQKTADEKAKLEEEKAAAKDNLALSLEAGLTSKFVNKNGQFFDNSTGKPFTDPQEFFKAAGVKSFEEAYQKGLVQDFTIDRIADRDFIQQARNKYYDAGILPNDSVETATQKIKKSRIYQKETYIAPTGIKSGSTFATGPGNSVTDFDILATAVGNKLGSVAAKNSFDAQYAKATTDEQRIKILASNVVLPSEIKNGIIQNTQVTKSLDDVLGMLNKGVETGLLAAGQSYVANKLGTGGDKEIEAIKSKLITAVQPYRNKVTGAAWGDQEEAEYQALIGSVKFAPEDLANKISVFKDTLKQQSQTALLAGIDPLGAINANSLIQSDPNLGGGGLKDQVTAKGYNYDQMRADGFSDKEIKETLGL